MSGWNYRVVKRSVEDRLSKTGHTELFDIQEVYYDNDNHISGFANASVDNWESVDDLKGTLLLMLKAFDKPVLEAPK